MWKWADVRLIRTRLSHARMISRWWWAVVAGGWSVFWQADHVIEKYASPEHKTLWDRATLHIPIDWRTWLIGLLAMGVVLVFEGSYEYATTARAIIRELTWPVNRPILLFDSWGEVPHDHPDADPSPATSYRPEPEYFKRGIYLTNDGGTAHDVLVHPAKIYRAISASSVSVKRIDANDRGFAFLFLDIEGTSRELGIVERWDLLSVMAKLNNILNANTTDPGLSVPIKAEYRDSNGVWYISSANMCYVRGANRIEFTDTVQSRGGLRRPS